MPVDLQSVQIAVAIVVGLLTILGVIFGWFAKIWGWATSFFRPSNPTGTIDVPKKTLILIPVPNALWWHMGSVDGQPAMQIVGDLNVTNISKYGVVVMGARLRKPRAVGFAVVRAQDSKIYSSGHMIPHGGISEAAPRSCFPDTSTSLARCGRPRVICFPPGAVLFLVSGRFREADER